MKQADMPYQVRATETLHAFPSDNNNKAEVSPLNSSSAGDEY